MSHNEGNGSQLGCSPRDLEAVGIASAHEQKELIWGLHSHCRRITIMRMICKQLATLPTYLTLLTAQAESTIGFRRYQMQSTLTVHSAHLLVCQAMKVIGVDADDLHPNASAIVDVLVMCITLLL